MKLLMMIFGITANSAAFAVEMVEVFCYRGDAKERVQVDTHRNAAGKRYLSVVRDYQIIYYQPAQQTSQLDGLFFSSKKFVNRNNVPAMLALQVYERDHKWIGNFWESSYAPEMKPLNDLKCSVMHPFP